MIWWTGLAPWEFEFRQGLPMRGSQPDRYLSLLSPGQSNMISISVHTWRPRWYQRSRVCTQATPPGGLGQEVTSQGHGRDSMKNNLVCARGGEGQVVTSQSHGAAAPITPDNQTWSPLGCTHGGQDGMKCFDSARRQPPPGRLGQEVTFQSHGAAAPITASPVAPTNRSSIPYTAKMWFYN